MLDYYELDGTRAAGGPGWRLAPSGTPAVAALPLVATDVGRRTWSSVTATSRCSPRAAPRPTWS